MSTIPRGAPPFAEDQRGFVLSKLREAGAVGVSRSTFIFELHITQCGARVDELKRQGYKIDSVKRPDETYVRYVLKSEPDAPKELPSYRQKAFRDGDGDWYRRVTGRERPSCDAPVTSNFGLLFSTSTASHP